MRFLFETLRLECFEDRTVCFIEYIRWFAAVSYHSSGAANGRAALRAGYFFVAMV